MNKIIERIRKYVIGKLDGFDTENYFSLRKKYYNSKNIFSEYYYKYRIKKIDGRRCSYIGLKPTDRKGEGDIFSDIPTMPHGVSSIFISSYARVGLSCVILEQVVLGLSKGKAPIIGNNCIIGAGAKIIGGCTIGNNCRIGAGAVVVKDVPDNCTVVAQPARILVRENGEDERDWEY